MTNDVCFCTASSKLVVALPEQAGTAGMSRQGGQQREGSDSEDVGVWAGGGGGAPGAAYNRHLRCHLPPPPDPTVRPLRTPTTGPWNYSPHYNTNPLSIKPVSSGPVVSLQLAPRAMLCVTSRNWRLPLRGLALGWGGPIATNTKPCESFVHVK